MKPLLRLLYSLLLLPFLACSPFMKGLTKKGDIVFEYPDSLHSGYQYLSYYQEKNKEYLVGINDDNFSIDFFDLSSRKLSKSIYFYKDGSLLNGEASAFRILNKGFFNSGIYGYYFSNPDSVYVQFKDDNHLYLMDSSRKILNSWDLSALLPYAQKYSLFVDDHNRFHIQGDMLQILITMEGESPYLIPFSKTALYYNLKTRTLIRDFVDYPDCFRNDKWWGFTGYEVNVAYRPNGNMIASFRVNDSLYEYSKAELIKRVSAPSRWLKDYNFPESDKKQRSNTEYKVNFIATSGIYQNILYDPYKKIFYRIVVHPQPLQNADGTYNRQGDNDWSVLVLDENLSVLTEKFFSGKKYNWSALIVTPKGLMISNDHELNPDYSEKRMSFSLFNFQ